MTPTTQVPIARESGRKLVVDPLALALWDSTRENDTRWWSVQAMKNAAAARVQPPAALRGASGHSDAWWHGVAICEQGGRNDSYFGFFSYMDGSAGGGMSWADQVAKGNRTIAEYGDHAWAQQCVDAGYRASPGG